MRYCVFVPRPDSSEQLPAGCALLGAARGGRLLMAPRQARQEPFAETCRRAQRSGRPVIVAAEELIEIGIWDDYEGQLRLTRPDAATLLGRWVGHPVYRNDLEAEGCQANQRAQARRMLMQGRTAEAFRLHPRGGL